MADQVCVMCERKPEDGPMVFRNDPWCSDQCRKEYENLEWEDS